MKINPTERIPLGGGQFALIDAADLPLVSGYRWRSMATPTGRYYAIVNVGKRTIYMHRLIAATPDGMVTDHANNDGLDNRRANLRPATWTQNIVNVEKVRVRSGRPATSRYKGVSWDKEKQKWHARIRNGRTIFLGRYESEIDAARAYDVAALAAYGEFAVLNFPDRVAEPSPYRPGRKQPAPRTHCPQRHEYTPENSRINGRGYRICVACGREKDAARWAAGKTSKQRSAAAEGSVAA